MVDTVVSGQTTISSGETATEHAVVNGGALNVSSGGTVLGPLTVSTGGAVTIGSGALLQGSSFVSSGGQIAIQSGGTIRNAYVAISSGGTLTVSNGAVGGNFVYDLLGGTVFALTYLPLGALRWTQSGGALIVQDKGVFNGGVISAGDNTLIVKSGGTAVGTTTVDSGAKILVQDEGHIFGDLTVSSGGLINIQSGGHIWDANIDILNGGVLSVNSGSWANDNVLYTLSGGTIVAKGPIFPNVHWTDQGGSIILSSGGTYSGGNIVPGKNYLIIESGGVTTGITTINSGAQVVVNSGGSVQGSMIVSPGGSLSISDGGKLYGQASIETGATATIGRNTSGIVNLADTGFTTLILTGSREVNTTIKGFNGSSPDNSDKIIFSDIPKSDIIGVTYPDSDHITFHLKDGSSFTLSAPDIARYGYELRDDGGSGTAFVACFLSGTLIRTPVGDVVVENIKEGDDVCTYKDDAIISSKVKWVGKNSVIVGDGEELDESQFPVRITQNAFREGIPYKDLLITPEHCVYISGYLIPVRMLVNGVSIYHDTTVRSYTYHHFETESHSVVMSNGLFTESYLGRLRTHSQNMTVAARQMAEKKTVGHLS